MTDPIPADRSPAPAVDVWASWRGAVTAEPAPGQVLPRDALPVLLQRIVSTARAAVHAEYAALRVVGGDGIAEQLVQVGVDEPGPSAGAAAPPVSVLGLPVRTAGAVYGTLFLAHRVGGGRFTREDEDLVRALAVTAGIAVENARLYEQAVRRQEWLRASADISQRLLQSSSADESLHLLAEHALRLADGDVVTVVVPVPDQPDLLEVTATAGQGDDEILGMRYSAAGTLAGRAMEEGGVLVDDLQQGEQDRVHLRVVVPVRDVMAICLRGEVAPLGVLVVARTAHRPFTPVEQALAGGFAEQAALALERNRLGGDRHRLELLEDQARIARDLHDHVIQRLFAAGLTVQSVAGTVSIPVLRTQLAATIQHLDAAIRTIRAFIVELQDIQLGTVSVRRTVVATVADLAPALGVAADVEFRGPVDTLVDEDLLVAVDEALRRWLTALVRRGGARTVEVVLEADAHHLVLTVADDAPSGPTVASAVEQLRTSAGRDDVEVAAAASTLGGTLLSWRVPLDR